MKILGIGPHYTLLLKENKAGDKVECRNDQLRNLINDVEMQKSEVII